MRLNFRQGIVSTQPGGFLLLNGGTGDVDLLADNVSVTVTIADKTSNYTHSEDTTVLSAWTGPFITATDYWLYWDFDTLNFTRTFGVTTLEPLAQPTIPPNIVNGQTWFDTTSDEMFLKTAAGFTKIFRVFAARFNSGTFFSESIDAPLFTGTQIGDTSSVRSGRILFTEFGNTIRRDDGTFFTTESEFFTNQSQVAAIRLEANVSRAKCTEAAIGAYAIVKFSGDGLIGTAQYNDTGETVIAVLTESLINGQVGSVLLQGSVTNPAWNWSTLPVGTFMYVDNGGLTSTDPHVSDSITNPQPQVPVARVLSRDTVIFEQGLGGVGPQGPEGVLSDVPPATLSIVGGVTLSSPSSTPLSPVVVETNDPRLSGSPFASQSHIHPAGDISYTGTIVATNVQTALDELDSGKVDIAGDTMTGFLTLSAAPTAALHATTKEYVDGLVSGLVWSDPVALVDLLDDSLATPPGSPADGDSYIIPPGGGTGLWSAFTVGNIVQWHATGSSWHDHGAINAQSVRRFMISGTSTTAGAGSFAGQDDNIAIYDAGGSLTGFEVPVLNTAVFVTADDVINQFEQYVYDGTKWVQFSSGSISPDGTTIVLSGGIISTKNYVDGGLVDAATYRGVDADTLYSQLGHSHNGSSINITAPFLGTDFGTPAIVNDDSLVSATIDLAVQELFNKKANKEPRYTDFTDLPLAANVEGMIAEVLNDAALYVSRGGSWVEIAVNDGTAQGHTHTIPYDLSFFTGGAAGSQTSVTLGMVSIARTMTIATGVTNAYGRALTAPAVTTTFFVHHNGVQVGTVIFDPSVSGGLIPVFSFPVVVNLVAGDYLEFIAPAIAENTIADVSVTIIACSDFGTCP